MYILSSVSAVLSLLDNDALVQLPKLCVRRRATLYVSELDGVYNYTHKLNSIPAITKSVETAASAI